VLLTKQTFQQHPLDNDFVIEFKAGDNSAFDELVKKYQDIIIAGCYRFLGNYADSQDAAQEVFLKVYFGLNTFSPDAKFSTWIHRILVNHCLNVLRSKRRKRLIRIGEEKDEVNAEDIISKEKSPLEILQNADKVKAIHSALGRLKEKQRVAIILHKFQGLPYKEVAIIQKCSVSAVEARIFRAKLKLAKLLINLK
jgi:RNA polymerase sigma-70 factor, ECF subfamily